MKIFLNSSSICNIVVTNEIPHIKRIVMPFSLNTQLGVAIQFLPLKWMITDNKNNYEKHTMFIKKFNIIWDVQGVSEELISSNNLTNSLSNDLKF